MTSLKLANLLKMGNVYCLVEVSDEVECIFVCPLQVNPAGTRLCQLEHVCY